jgi:branched-chain amino acid aminotransferase
VPAVWLDGYLYPDGDARIPVFDHAVIVGDGVFETCKVLDGEPFALSRHLDRLARSAAAVGLDAPAAPLLRAAAADVLGADPGAGRLRIMLTSGPGPLGSARGGAQPSLLLATGGPSVWPAAERVVVVPWTRNERGALAGVKSTSYGENVQALRFAHERGAGEALFANTRGELCEGTGTNVFLAVAGVLVTPPVTSGCLAGITRELLLEQIAVEERAISLDALAEATEVFLTSSTRDVQPVDTVDGRPVPSCRGPFTEKAMEAFAALQARTLDP